MQVDCCLEAAGQFIVENAFAHCPEQVLGMAQSLGLQVGKDLCMKTADILLLLMATCGYCGVSTRPRFVEYDSN